MPPNENDRVVMVSGAGGKAGALNGAYHPRSPGDADPTANGKPVFVSGTGALLYFRGYWKINLPDNGGLWGWVYGDPRGGDRELPATGTWSCEGSRNGEKLPQPKIEILNPNRSAHRLSQLVTADPAAVPALEAATAKPAVRSVGLEPVHEPTESEILASVQRSRDQIRARAEAEAQRSLAADPKVTLRRTRKGAHQPASPGTKAEAEVLATNPATKLRQANGPEGRPRPNSSASTSPSSSPTPNTSSEVPAPAAKRAPVPRPRPLSTLIPRFGEPLPSTRQYQPGPPSSPMAPKAAALTFAAGRSDNSATSTKAAVAPDRIKPREPHFAPRPVSQEAHSFKMVTKALVASGLGEMLGSTDYAYTVLAPTDDAFEKFAEEWGLSGQAYLEEIATNSQLQRQIQGLVIEGKVSSSDISQKKQLRAINGDVVRCGHDGQVELDGGFEAEFIRRDHACGNGIIHVIG